MIDVIERYHELRATRRVLRKDLKKKRKRQRELKRVIRDLKTAKDVLITASKEAQATIKQELEALVNLCISAVYSRPFKFELLLEDKPKPVITENGNILDPKDDAAGGLIDIISFSVPIGLWYLDDVNKTRPLFIYDEPFKNTGDLISKAGAAMKFLSDHLEIQILLVSHEDELIDLCDKAYQISHDGQKSVLAVVRRKITRRH